MIQSERVKRLNNLDTRPGRYVLYWMQQSQRAEANHALEFAAREADRLELPLVAVFGITQRFPEAERRHYAFMLEGLAETARALAARGIRLVVRVAPPHEAALELAERAALVVTDRGYLRVQREWRDRVAARARCPVVQIESDAVVPIETASEKEEYAARTLRPRIQRHLDRFLVPLDESGPRRESLSLRLRGVDVSDPERVIGGLKVADAAGPAAGLRGGPSRAKRLLEEFVASRLRAYTPAHSDPGRDAGSHLSAYLHFGQVSPLAVALAVAGARGVPKESKDAFLEELIVRRELSMNFCRFNRRYDSYDCLPEWAKRTLGRHAADHRAYVYSVRQLERACTHDEYWNAAQTELRVTGAMHGYMRMYWGKKIIEWSPTPQEAFRRALHLNNTYQLDGRDPNSFAGVAWCFGKHDRPWGERPVFGQIRWMSADGLERKFDMERYVRRVRAAADAAQDTRRRE